MKWVSAFIATFLLTLTTLSKEIEKPLWEEFSFKFYPSIGLGIQPMDSNKTTYLTAKIFVLQYGPDEIGFSFFGVGYSQSTYNGSGSFSPLGLRANNWLVTLDIHQNRSDFVGASLNYYFP